MSNGGLARRDDDSVELELDEVEHADDDSVVSQREARAPTITRLGRYRLVREIASGGMASVHLAVADGLDKLVALKVIHPHLAQEQSFVAMFLDEARIASSISHRNVCSVFDFGEADGRFYIAMDYLAGQSLRDIIARVRKLPTDADPRRVAVYAAHMIAEACEGLHAAHELRNADGQLLEVVHRDVSPHNLFVTYDGNVSVVDFGIARAADRMQHTATGVLKGKFSYMAPEQIRQLPVDRRADIWALGVCLWETLTRERLFVRSSQADTLMSVMMDRVRAPSEIRPDLPKELDAIVLCALARSPDKRFATAREMGRALSSFCRQSGVLSGPVELEQWMEQLFPREIAASKQLVRHAKQSSVDNTGAWLEATPSGFPYIPTRSGAIRRAPGGSIGSSSGADAFAPREPLASRAPDSEVALEPSRVATMDARGKATNRRHAALVVATICTIGALAFAWRFERPVTQVPHALPATSQVVSTSSPTVAEPRAVPATPPAAVAPAQPAAAEGVATVLPSEQPPDVTERRTTRTSRTMRMADDPSNESPTEQGAPRTEPPASADAKPEEPSVAAATAAPAAALAPTVSTLDAAPAQAVAAAPSTPEPSAPAQAVSAAVPSKPTPSAPAPSAPKAPVRLEANVSIADLEVEGSLGSGVVGRMMQRALPLVRECYASAAGRAGRNDLASLPVALTIDEAGSVRQVEVGSHPLSTLPACVTGAVKRMRSDRKPDVGTVRVRAKLGFHP